METHILKPTNLADLSITIPKEPETEISRTSIHDTLERIFDNYIDVIFLEGAKGSGKTNTLAQFCKRHNTNSISHFFDPADRYTYSHQYFKTAIFNQIYFFVNDAKVKNENEDENIGKIRINLDRRIKKSQKPLYLILDGLEDIPVDKKDIIADIIADLPWGKMKVLISGDSDYLKSIIPSKTIKHKTHQISYFTISETKQYLESLDINEEEINELYKISNKGLPGKLEQIKRICQKHSVAKFLIEDITEKSDLFEIEWEQVLNDDNHHITLALLAYDDVKYSSQSLASRVNLNENEIESIVEKYSFLSNAENLITYVSEHFRIFAAKKLIRLKEKALNLSIDYFLANNSSEESYLNLPHLLQKANRQKELINWLSIDTFVALLNQHQSLTTINQQFDFGLNAISESDKSSSDLIRFSLLKSAFREIERHNSTESEIVARISLRQTSEAYEIATSAYLKEDRLKLLAELAKHKKLLNLVTEPEVITQITELYQQIDFRTLGKECIDLASTLLYSCPDLAIDLIEKISDHDPHSSFRDIAYSKLSLNAVIAKSLNKEASPDVDLLTTKITDPERKQETDAMVGLLADYDANQIIRRVDELQDTSKKLFFLERWIIANQEAAGIEDVVNKAITVIISNASEEEPSATLVSKIATPLPKIKEMEKLTPLIKLFDSQKNTITHPTEDFIKLQLLLAQAVATYNYALAKDRYIEIYHIFISDIKDKSTKATCLACFLSILKPEPYGLLIEKEEGLLSLASNDLDREVTLMVKDTAYHDKLIEGVIKYLAKSNFELCIKYISDLNTQMRRDVCYAHLIDTHISDCSLNTLDFQLIWSTFNKIDDKGVKDELCGSILNKYAAEEQIEMSVLNSLKAYINVSRSISHTSTRCKSLVNATLILHGKEDLQSLNSDIQKTLKETWACIDISWHKIDVGFQIAGRLSKRYPDLAAEYLDWSVEERDNVNLLDSTTVADTYILSVRLCIRAFGGLIRRQKDLDSEIARVGKLIQIIPSNGEQCLLWGKVALTLRRKDKHNEFRTVVQKYIKPSLDILGERDPGYREFVLIQVAPALFLYHPQTFFDQIEAADRDTRDSAYYCICNFIMSKMPIGEPFEFSEKGYKIEHEEAKDICSVLKRFESDEYTFTTVSRLIKCIKNHKLVPIHTNDIKKEIQEHVFSKFPKAKYGIKHNGFIVAIKAILAGLDPHDENKWETLKQEARLLPNISDAVFVLMVIAEEISIKFKKLKIDTLNEAYEYAKLIPANYDKFERSNEIISKLSQLGKAEFLKLSLELGADVSNFDDDEINARHKELVDMLYQHDPTNVDKYMSILDNDIVRRNKFKKAIEKQVDKLKVRDEVKEDFKHISKLKYATELFSFSRKMLRSLNSDKITPRNIDDLFPLLKNATEFSLSDSYYIFSLYIENIVRKYENSTSPKNLEYMSGVFESTIFCANMIDILSQNNALKVKHRVKVISADESSNISVFTIGERDRFDSYLRAWLEENLSECIYIIDPYFSEHDLSCLKIIKELSPNCEVYILSSKEEKNRHDNTEDAYRQAWNAISYEKPPRTIIKIVWREVNLKSPFHDRWWIPEGAQTGLRFGTSYSSVGISKDTEISVMSIDDSKNIEATIIKDYIEGNVRKYGSEKLKSLSFELD